MSPGSTVSASCATSGPPSPASPIAGSARLPTITGWTNSTATWRASERAEAEAPAAISRPPAAKRSAIAWHSRAIRSASASKNRAPPPPLRPAGACPPRRHAGARTGTRSSHDAELLDALARAGAELDRLDAGMDRVEVVQVALHVEVHVREQVELVDHDQLAGAEHQRVLERLVLALGDRGDHDPHVLADPELGRADEVADVLDDQQVDLLQRQRGERGADHVRVQVALAAEAVARVELDDRQVQRGEPVGVERALHVALQHPGAHGDVARARARAASSCPRRARSSGSRP